MNGEASSGRAAGMPRGGGTRHVVLVSAVAALGTFLFGYDTGVVAGALLFIREDFGGLTSLEQGAIVSGTLLGGMLGALGAGWTADRLGRRRTILTIAATFLVGLPMIILAGSIWTLIAGRVIIGLGIGGASITVPLYISELAPARVRGTLVSINQLLMALGQLVAFLVAYAFAASGSWRWMFGVALVPSIALALGALLLPESPRWLVARGRVDDARSVLARIHQEELLDDELALVRDAESNRPGWRALLRPGLRMALIVGIGLALLQQITGINTVIYYAPTIMSSTGLSSSSSILASVAVGAINVIMVIVAMTLIDRVGRRPLLLVSLVGMVVSLAVLGAAFELQSLGAALNWVALACMVAYVAAFAIGLGPVFWLLIAEIYPLRVRGEAMSLASAANWLGNFAVGLTFLVMVDALGQAGTFWLYAAVGVVAIAFTALLVPETRHRSLEQIELAAR